VVRFSNDRSKTPVARPGRRADQRRVEILRAAAAVFRKRGFAAAGMREIATAADLSAANLYHYFSGKEEILYFCQDRALDRLLTAAREAGEARSALVPRLTTLAAAHIRCILDQVEGSAAHFEVGALPPRLRARIVAKRDRYEQQVRALIAAGILRRELAAPDATIATRAFLGALNWTVQWFRPGGPHTVDHVAAAVAAFAVAGLQPIQPPQHQWGGSRAHLADHQRRGSRSGVRPLQDPAGDPS
jgi:AcrR family transcriptional regulator